MWNKQAEIWNTKIITTCINHLFTTMHDQPTLPKNAVQNQARFPHTFFEWHMRDNTVHQEKTLKLWWNEKLMRARLSILSWNFPFVILMLPGVIYAYFFWDGCSSIDWMLHSCEGGWAGLYSPGSTGSGFLSGYLPWNHYAMPNTRKPFVRT